jgi:hypothetical protein
MAVQAGVSRPLCGDIAGPGVLLAIVIAEGVETCNALRCRLCA